MATSAVSRRLSRRTFAAFVAVGICAENRVPISDWASERAVAFNKAWMVQPQLLQRYPPEVEAVTQVQFKREAQLKARTGTLEENCWSKPLIKFSRGDEDEGWQVVGPSDVSDFEQQANLERKPLDDENEKSPSVGSVTGSGETNGGGNDDNNGL